jgi:hypothetical protein
LHNSAERFTKDTAAKTGSRRTVEIAPDGTIKLVPVEPTKSEVAKKREIIL